MPHSFIYHVAAAQNTLANTYNTLAIIYYIIATQNTLATT